MKDQLYGSLQQIVGRNKDRTALKFPSLVPYLTANMHQIRFQLEPRLKPRRGAHSAPQTLDVGEEGKMELWKGVGSTGEKDWKMLGDNGVGEEGRKGTEKMTKVGDWRREKGRVGK